MLDALKRLDLNLLVVFDILLDERSVTRAAARLSLSQPATSAALARLRACLNDELLIRKRGEMLLTERASALRQPIKEALRTVAQALETRDTFQARTFDGRFRLAALDVTNFNLGSDIVKYLRRNAPCASAEFIALDRSRLYEWLKNDVIDAAIVVFKADEGVHETEHLFDDELVFVASPSHPLRKKRAQSFARLSRYPLIEVSAAASTMRPFFEHQEVLGRKWSPMITVPYFSVLPSMLEGNDCIGVMGRVAAQKFEKIGTLAIIEVSEPMPIFHYKMIWHERRSYDPAHRWMRAMIRSITERKDKRSS
jgi:LysR family transcriptional regulator, mexEF-oprN operon transcriptional activator